MIQGTWEVVLLANTAGMVNGGLAGLFWGYIWTFVGFFSIVMSLAEMASMAPTSGGQYHWQATSNDPMCAPASDYCLGFPNSPRASTRSSSATCPVCLQFLLPMIVIC